MPSLVASFVDDWIDHLSAQMRACWGNQVDSIPREDIPKHFFDSLRRRVNIRPRELKLSDVFVPPDAPRTDWSAFARKVRDGNDLNPHLSLNHESLFYRDGLLNDWGIHHFHLNMQPHPKNAKFLDRTGHLVMAYVTEDAFHVIGVYPHRPLPWGKVELIEILHRNWPEAIARFKLHGISPDQKTEDHRANLRKRGLGQFTTVADGTVYGPLGGMHSFGTDSVSMKAVQLADFYEAKISGLQTDLERELPQLLEKLKSRGHDGESELFGKLMFSEKGVLVHLPDYSLYVDVTYLDKPQT